jgi:translation initiation factor 2B subunit (eIF-2B alpha/beta/delta family)
MRISRICSELGYSCVACCCIPDSQVETILSGNLNKVLVGANTGGLKSLFWSS